MKDEVVARLAAADRLLVATDFDGVLAPIIDDPASVSALPASMASLRKLAALADTTVAVVSGRDYDLLARLVAPADCFTLAGSHGAELGVTRLSPGEQADLDRLVGALDRLADRFPGLHIETKTVSVAAHFRRVVERREEVLAAVDRLVDRWPAKIVAGKEVVEFSLGLATKGDAIRTVIEREDITATVYFGDDATDEDVFAVLDADDVGVKVGAGATLAGHRLNAPDDVARVLGELAEARAAIRRP